MTAVAIKNQQPVGPLSAGSSEFVEGLYPSQPKLIIGPATVTDSRCSAMLQNQWSDIFQDMFALSNEEWRNIGTTSSSSYSHYQCCPFKVPILFGPSFLFFARKDHFRCL